MCGQHAHTSARNLAAVVHDGWHDITHVDGRLWYTLWLLLARPGQLTREYFEEHRARYLPPVRLYLVLSVVFFSFGLSLTSSTSSTSDRKPPAAVAASGAPAAGSAAPAAPAAPDATAKDDDDDDADEDAQRGAPPASAGPSKNVGIHYDVKTGQCDINIAASPLLERAARGACERFKADNGRTFLKTLTHNIPKMMFVFLPLLAAVMVPLYLWPRRFYVEHLVFLLHNHSALYLVFTLANLAGLLARLWHPLRYLSGVAIALVIGYVVWYPYQALRRYYQQGRFLTLTKYVAIAFAYLMGLIITLTGTAIVSALEG